MRCGFRLTDLPGHAVIEDQLMDLGYVRDNPNLVMLNSSIENFAGNITEMAIEEWLDTIYTIHPVDDPNMKDWEHQFLMKITLPSRYVVVMDAGQACGYGRSVLQDNILNLENLWVQPDMRDQGLGTQLIQGLMQMGYEDGAEIAYLTVNQSNPDAQRLSKRLGFESIYSYRYLVPESEAD